MIEDYLKAVKTGQRRAGRLERLAVDYFERLRRKYDYDANEVERILNIFHLFRHTKGQWQGKHFDVLPHQAFFLAAIFGLKKPDGFRLVNEAMMCMAKKGGKSEFGGGLAVVFTFFDGENKAQNYVVANKTEQALFCWNSARDIAKGLAADFEDFADEMKLYDTKMEHRLIHTATENYLKTLPYESNTLDGVDPHLAIVDEFHEYPDMSVPNNLESGMVLRRQPLLLFVTTRGFHPFGPLGQKEELYEGILTGETVLDNVFPLIFSLDDDKNWQNKNYWIQFAPGIDHGLPSYESLERQMQKALSQGGEELNNTKIKNFNICQTASIDFCDFDKYQEGAEAIDEATLQGRHCYCAIDIGRTDDLTALGYLFPPDDLGGQFLFVLRLFMPADLVTKRSIEHKVSYRKWIDDGLIIATPGNYTDTTYLVQQVLEDSQRFEIREITADRTFAVEMINNLSRHGFEVTNFPQNYSAMTAPVLKLQEIINAGLFRHGGNEVLLWMAKNVQLKKDSGGRVMMDKSDRVSGKGVDRRYGKNKIDGMVVAAMCVGAWFDAEGKNLVNAEDIISWI